MQTVYSEVCVLVNSIKHNFSISKEYNMTFLNNSADIKFM